MALGCPLYFHSVRSRTTSGDIKMNFGRAERGRYKKFIVLIYATFLQKCYCKSFHVILIRCFITLFNLAPEECCTRALPMEEGFESLATMDLESAGANFYYIVQISKKQYTRPLFLLECQYSANGDTGIAIAAAP